MAKKSIDDQLKELDKKRAILKKKKADSNKKILDAENNKIIFSVRALGIDKILSSASNQDKKSLAEKSEAIQQAIQNILK